MKELSLGRLYFTGFTLPKNTEGPYVVKGWTAEVDEPYRTGTCWIVRTPLTRRAVAVGWWGEPTNEEHALTLGTGMRPLERDEVDTLDYMA